MAQKLFHNQEQGRQNIKLQVIARGEVQGPEYKSKMISHLVSMVQNMKLQVKTRGRSRAQNNWPKNYFKAKLLPTKGPRTYGNALS